MIRLDELKDEELERMYTEAAQLIRDETKQKVASLGTFARGEQKQYVIEIAKEENVTAVSVLPAIKCPTEPPIYINIWNKDAQTGTLRMFVMLKDRDMKYELVDITLFGIRIAERIVEGNNQRSTSSAFSRDRDLFAILL